MNGTLVRATFEAPTTKRYLAKDGRHWFTFEFTPNGGEVEIYCRSHPPLNGRDPDPHKTHLFSSGKVCLVDGREPRTLRRAEQLAAQWAEYFLEYRRTGKPQS